MKPKFRTKSGSCESRKKNEVGNPQKKHLFFKAKKKLLVKKVVAYPPDPLSLFKRSVCSSARFPTHSTPSPCAATDTVHGRMWRTWCGRKGWASTSSSFLHTPPTWRAHSTPTSKGVKSRWDACRAKNPGFIGQAEFVRLFDGVLLESFAGGQLREGFANCGLVPPNFAKMEAKEAKRRSTSATSSARTKPWRRLCAPVVPRTKEARRTHGSWPTRNHAGCLGKRWPPCGRSPTKAAR